MLINFVDATNDANHYTKPAPTLLRLENSRSFLWQLRTPLQYTAGQVYMRPLLYTFITLTNNNIPFRVAVVDVYVSRN